MTTEQREAKRVYMAAYHAAHRDERRAYYAAHKEREAETHREYRAAHKYALLEQQRQEHAGFTEWLQILRDVTGCEDGGPHEGRLEHHHVDPATKRYCITHMSTHSLDSLEDELEKCVVLCDACHTRRHVEMRAA